MSPAYLTICHLRAIADELRVSVLEAALLLQHPAGRMLATWALHTRSAETFARSATVTRYGPGSVLSA